MAQGQVAIKCQKFSLIFSKNEDNENDFSISLLSFKTLDIDSDIINLGTVLVKKSIFRLNTYMVLRYILVSKMMLYVSVMLS